MVYHIEDLSNSYKTKKEEYAIVIKPLLDDVSKEIDFARKKYKVTFENPNTFDPEESDYRLLLDGIKERLDVITARTKVIDHVTMDEDENQRTLG